MIVHDVHNVHHRGHSLLSSGLWSCCCWRCSCHWATSLQHAIAVSHNGLPDPLTISHPDVDDDRCSGSGAFICTSTCWKLLASAFCDFMFFTHHYALRFSIIFSNGVAYYFEFVDLNVPAQALRHAICHRIYGMIWDLVIVLMWSSAWLA